MEWKYTQAEAIEEFIAEVKQRGFEVSANDARDFCPDGITHDELIDSAREFIHELQTERARAKRPHNGDY